MIQRSRFFTTLSDINRFSNQFHSRRGVIIGLRNTVFFKELSYDELTFCIVYFFFLRKKISGTRIVTGGKKLQVVVPWQ
jgi:hypothetical protein